MKLLSITPRPGEVSPWQWLALTSFVVVALLLPLWLGKHSLFIGITLMTYAALTLGLDLLMGRAGQFAFSHLAFYGIGAYTTAVLQQRWGVPFPIGVLTGVVFSAVLGSLIARIAVRMHHIYLGLATVAFASAAHWVFLNWTVVTGGVDGLRLQPVNLGFGPVEGDAAAFRLLAVMLAGLIAVLLLLLRSRLGREFTAIRDSEPVAAVSGVNVARVKIIAFAVSSAFASVAGSMLVASNSFVSPDNFGFAPAIVLLIMLVVGGMGTVPGVLIGTVLIGLLPELLRNVLKGALIWQEFVYGLILLLAITLMPQGVWGLLQQRWSKGASK
jgi:branched-chain amino acid transport system permease protein